MSATWARVIQLATSAGSAFCLIAFGWQVALVYTIGGAAGIVWKYADEALET